MGLIYVFIGLPVTLLLFGIGVLFLFIGIKLYKIIKSNISKIAILFIFCIPLIFVVSLYLGGLVVSLIYWFGENNNIDLILTIMASSLTATGNIIQPGSIMVSGSGKEISTINETILSSLVLLFFTIYLIKKYHNKNS